jgi:LysM repeat protein
MNKLFGKIKNLPQEEYPLLTKISELEVQVNLTLKEFSTFFRELYDYVFRLLHLSFLRFETSKSIFVTILYRQRGKYARRLMHSGMAGLTALGMMIAPVIAQAFPGQTINPWDVPSPSALISASTEEQDTTMLVSDKPRDKTIEYKVQDGDTISLIADKFGVSVDTILWQNSLTQTSKIKASQTLEILPVTGVSHKVQKGDTIYSIAKQYDAAPQSIIDFPYNSFVNDETFELAIGQTLIVPEGVRPSGTQNLTPRIRQTTPDAGTVVASGTFVWPTSGTITQRFSWYHPGADIANRATPDILAADSGTVTASGWDNAGYGNRVIIDHGNGYKTLYGHMQKLYVVAGQTVSRGSAIGKMGSTGRSSGPHLHFEIYKGGVRINPLSMLQ